MADSTSDDQSTTSSSSSSENDDKEKDNEGNSDNDGDSEMKDEEEEVDDNEEEEEEEDDDDGDDQQEQQLQKQQQQQQQPRKMATTSSIIAPTLSKSWSILKAQAPLYTGGKVAVLLSAPHQTNKHHNPHQTHSPHAAADAMDSASDALPSSSLSLLLLPVRGNVAIVDLATGSFKGMLRRRRKQQQQQQQQKNSSKHGGGGEESETNITNTNEYDVNDYDFDDDDDDDDDHDPDAITAFCCSQNNHNMAIVTCSHNSILRQYNNSSSNSVFSLHRTWGRSGHTLPVTCMAMSAHGIFVATGSLDGSVRIWDARDGAGFATHVFSSPSSRSSSGSSGGVSCLSWKKDGASSSLSAAELILAVGREDGSIALHNLLADAAASTPVALLHDHVSAVTCITWSTYYNHHGHNQQQEQQQIPILLTAGRDAVINLWASSSSTTTSSATTTTKDDSHNKKKNKKHKKITTGNSSSWLSSFQCFHTLPIYEQVEGLVLLLPSNSSNPNSIMFATAGSKGVVRMWKVASPTLSASSTITTIASGSSTIEAASRLLLRIDPVMVQLPPPSSSPSTTTTATTAIAGYSALVHDPWNSKLIVAEAAEHNLHWLEETSLQTQRTLVGHWDDILDLRIMVSDNSRNSMVRIAVATNSPEIRLLEEGGIQNKRMSSSSSSPSSSSSSVLRGHTATVLCLDASPCGRLLASCGKDRQVRLWNLQTEHEEATAATTLVSSCVAVAVGHTEAVGAVAFSRQRAHYSSSRDAFSSSSGAFLVSVSGDRTLKRWNLPNLRNLLVRKNITQDQDDGPQQDPVLFLSVSATVRAHEKDINMVAVAPNDSLVATASQDKTVKLWATTTSATQHDFKLKATLKGHKRGVWDVQFSPVDRVVATASGDKTLKLWSLTDYSCVRTFQGHVSSVLRVRFLSCGLQLVSSGADGLIKLWTIRTNECDTTLENGHYGKVWALDIANHTNNGNINNGNDQPLMVSGGSDSRLVFWKDTTVQEAQAKQQEQEETIMMDQKLANHLRHKEYSQALEIALQRDKPLQVFKVLISIIEADLEKGNNGVDAMQKQVKRWSTEQLVQILRYCREWNTRARNCHVAMVVCKAIVSSIPLPKLATMDGGSVPEILAGILVYSERHFERLDRLHTSSYLLDFALSGMDSLDADEKVTTDFAEWEQTSKLVLPPKQVDGRIQIGGSAVVGRKSTFLATAARDKDDGDESVVTIGDSSESSSEDES